jgi:4-amino-4-deoxy-L-arabinose transferase-like glycosyltransferase
MNLSLPRAVGAAMPPAGRWLVLRRPLRLALSVAGVPLVMLVAALLLRATSFLPSVIDTDEGLYILQARDWLRGGWPYVAVWDMHPVGAPALIAAAMTLLGESIAAVRFLGALAVAATGTMLFLAVRVVGAPRVVGLAAGLIYIAQTALLGGLATNTEILFAPFVAGAMVLALQAAARAWLAGQAPGWRTSLAIGGLIGLALTIKPVVVPTGCLAFVALVLPAWWRGLIRPGRVLGMAAGYTLACAGPTLLIGLAYAARGEFGALWDGAILAPLRYVGEPIGAIETGRRVVAATLVVLFPFLLAVVALLPGGAARPEARGPGRLLAIIGVLWFLAASACVAMPGMYFQHYFLIWLPPLSLLAALGARRLSRLFRPGLAALAFAGVVGAVAVDAWLDALVPRIEQGARPDAPRRVAAAIAREIVPGEPIFIANYHPVVYVLARAAVPTRYAFPGHLTCAYDRITSVDADAEIARVLATRPRIVVVDRGWWGAMRRRAAALIANALDQNYVRVASIEEERGPVEIWRRRP